MRGRLTIAVTKFSENLQENCFKVAYQQMSINGHEFFQVKLQAVIKEIPPGYTSHSEKD